MDSRRTQLYLANVFIKSKKFAEAEKLLIDLISSDPSNYKYHYNLSIVYSERLNIKNAIDSFVTVLTLIVGQLSVDHGNDFNEFLSDIHGNLSALHIKDSNPIEAEEHCRLGLEYNPCSRICLYNMNICLRQLNRMEESIKKSWLSINLTRPSIIDSLIIDKSDTFLSNSSYIDTLKITYICVKWGTKYSSDYVNRLYGALVANSSEPFEHMVCYTDEPYGIRPEIVCKPFDAALKDWTGWWLKAAIFNDADATSRVERNSWCVYFDLDTVICNSIDFLFSHLKVKSFNKNVFCTLNASNLSSEGRNDGINSSLMIWKKGTWSYIYNFLLIHYRTMLNCIYKFDHFLEMMLLNYHENQCSDNNDYVYYLNKIHEDKIVDYKDIAHHIKNNDIVSDCRIICFPLKPKPHEIDNEIIDKYWKFI